MVDLSSGDLALLFGFMGVNEQTEVYDSYGSEASIFYMEYAGYRTRSYSEPYLSLNELFVNNKFSVSWDWLMPVVERVSCFPSPSGGTHNVSHYFLDGVWVVRVAGFSDVKSESLHDAFLLAVLEFIRHILGVHKSFIVLN